MQSNPFISIILPVYNVEKYIRECLISILKQTFTDFELIIIDDGSCDESISITKMLIDGDDRVILISQENAGLSSARNKGLNFVKGKYVLFIDSDDYIHLEALETIYKILLRRQEVELLAFKAIAFKDGDSKIEAIKVDEYNKYYSRQYLNEEEYDNITFVSEMNNRNNFIASACLYVCKSEILFKYDIKFKEGIIHEDELFTRELFCFVKKIFYTSHKIYFRRLRENSITQSPISINKIYSYIFISEALIRLYKLYKLSFCKKDALIFYEKAFDLAKYNFKNNKEISSRLLKSNIFFRSRQIIDILIYRFKINK